MCPKLSRFMDVCLNLEDSEKHSVLANYKKFDRNAELYAQLKRDSTDIETSKSEFLRLQSGNVLSVQAITMWQKPVIYPMIGL